MADGGDGELGVKSAEVRVAVEHDGGLDDFFGGHFPDVARGDGEPAGLEAFFFGSIHVFGKGEECGEVGGSVEFGWNHRGVGGGRWRGCGVGPLEGIEGRPVGFAFDAGDAVVPVEGEEALGFPKGYAAASDLPCGMPGLPLDAEASGAGGEGLHEVVASGQGAYEEFSFAAHLVHLGKGVFEVVGDEGIGAVVGATFEDGAVGTAGCADGEECVAAEFCPRCEFEDEEGGGGLGVDGLDGAPNPAEGAVFTGKSPPRGSRFPQGVADGTDFILPAGHIGDDGIEGEGIADAADGVDGGQTGGEGTNGIGSQCTVWGPSRQALAHGGVEGAGRAGAPRPVAASAGSAHEQPHVEGRPLFQFRFWDSVVPCHGILLSTRAPLAIRKRMADIPSDIGHRVFLFSPRLRGTSGFSAPPRPVAGLGWHGACAPTLDVSNNPIVTTTSFFTQAIFFPSAILAPPFFPPPPSARGDRDVCKQMFFCQDCPPLHESSLCDIF